MLPSLGIIAADVIAAYGKEAISGSILLDAIPCRSMHLQIAHPVIMETLPGLVSLEQESFCETATSFIRSCVAENYDIPTKDFFDMALNLSIPVSSDPVGVAKY